MVGDRQLFLHDLLHGVEEALERRRIRVGVRVAELAVDLRKRRRT